MPSREATRRLFIGLALPIEMGERLMNRVRPTLAGETGVRVSAPADLHVTLCFLGDFPEARIDELGGAFQEEIRGLSAPELCLSGTGGFPDLAAPRVLWASVEEDDESVGRMDALHNRVQQAARSMGWRPPAKERERPFRPHLTLARVRREGREGRETASFERHFGRLSFADHWVPVEVALFESRPDRPGERYPVLKAVPLVVKPG